MEQSLTIHLVEPIINENDEQITLIERPQLTSSSSVTIINDLRPVEKSKKKKRKITQQDKTELWNIFDTQIVNENAPKMECSIQTIQDREFCDHCSAILAISEEGFPTCTNDKCGITYKDILDQSAEWRYYGADDNQSSDPTRCGMPTNPLLEQSSYGCKVLCNGPISYEMRKIRRYTEWQSVPYKEKSQYEEFQRISIYAQNAGISKKIIDDAMVIHKKISEYEQTFRGDNKDGLLAASIYISFRMNKYPRTAKELASVFHLDVTSATQGCKNAMSIINELENNVDVDDKTTFCKTKPEDFIERYCSKLGINLELTKLCKFIAIKIEKENLMQSNTPHSIAGGIVYYISQLCNLNISKTDVHNISEISEVTINKCCKILEGMTSRLIPPVIVRKYNIQI